MEIGPVRATRGFGFLENFLARLRAKKVGSLIPRRLVSGRILDFGCGSYPHFLLAVDFREKYGLDKSRSDYAAPGLQIQKFDFGEQERLPFPDGYFSLVTALAVAEHLDPSTAQKLWCEIHRVLQPGGCFILTTPAAQTKGLLELMARLKLASVEEVADHKQYYDEGMLIGQLLSAGFSSEKVRVSRFEWGANILAQAEK